MNASAFLKISLLLVVLATAEKQPVSEIQRHSFRNEKFNSYIRRKKAS
jgi:hypothetical protein